MPFFTGACKAENSDYRKSVEVTDFDSDIAELAVKVNTYIDFIENLVMGT